jgi:dethiobiotin synthetase
MSKFKALFITGTDTGIGKTWVTRCMADYLGTRHFVTCMKPVQTGCVKNSEGELQAPDFDHIMEGKARMNGTYSEHVPYRYEPGCSPHLAASLAGTNISFDHISSSFAKVAAGTDITLVEGAGGILAPLSETTYIIDLIVHLNLPVIVVTSPKLGTLNHTFLTLRVLRESGLHIAGIIVNAIANEQENFILEENLRMIRQHTTPIPFATIPYGTCGSTQFEEFCDAVTKSL